MAKVVIVNGSPNAASRLTGILNHAEQLLAKSGIQVEAIHVADLPANDLVFGRYDKKEIKEAIARVGSADAVLFASPVYKASYTGLLKLFIDLLPRDVLADKWVAPVFIGGTIAHLLSVDFGFKPVAAAIGARRFAPVVYAVDTQVTRTEKNGELHYELDAELKERLEAAIRQLAAELGAAVAAPC
jgi:FMN reductase